MWVCASDYADDLRIGPEILKTTVETYRKLRNTIRWMLGNLAHFRDEDRIAPDKMPELERLMLHRLAELDALVRKAYTDFDTKRIFAALSHFMVEQGPTADELAKAKAYLKGSYALAFDTSSKIANQLLHIQLDDLGIDYVDRRNGLIDAVTLDDAKRAAKRLAEGGMFVTVVGRAKQIGGKDSGG